MEQMKSWQKNLATKAVKKVEAENYDLTCEEMKSLVALIRHQEYFLDVYAGEP